VKAVRTAVIARRAVAVFGTEGPSGDARTRSRQVDLLPGAAHALWDALDREFYASGRTSTSS
jgi:hypothetical protein